jgi:hypothetical protein
MLMTVWALGPGTAVVAVGSAAPCDPNELDPNAAVFTRAGTGYLGGPNGMTAYPANVMRRKWELSCSAGKIEVPTDELEDPGDPNKHYDAIPWCVTSNGLWATRRWVDHQATAVWVTSDGSQWKYTGETNDPDRRGYYICDSASLFALRSGRLVAFGVGGGDWGVGRGDWHTLWSDDGTR